MVDDPELNYTTSGLGSSVNPGTQIASNGGSVQENSTILSPSTLGESKPVKSNNWKVSMCEVLHTNKWGFCYKSYYKYINLKFIH